MTADDALASIRNLAVKGCFRIAGDATWSLGAHGATFEDVGRAHATAQTCTPMGARWRVAGSQDLDGRAMGAIVLLDADRVDVESVF